MVGCEDTRSWAARENAPMLVIQQNRKIINISVGRQVYPDTNVSNI
jgi:hypothetical protein